jgi:hypothetical protein
MSLTLHLPVDVSSERVGVDDHPHRDSRIKPGAMLTLAAGVRGLPSGIIGEGGHACDAGTFVAHPFMGGGANPNVLVTDWRPHR